MQTILYACVQIAFPAIYLANGICHTVQQSFRQVDKDLLQEQERKICPAKPRTTYFYPKQKERNIHDPSKADSKRSGWLQFLRSWIIRLLSLPFIPHPASQETLLNKENNDPKGIVI